MIVTRKFRSTVELMDFMNGGPVKEYGQGYVNSNVLHAVSAGTVYSNWQDIDGSGTDLSGYVVISGSDTYTALSSAASATSTNIASLGNVGTQGNPVYYRIYTNEPLATNTIVHLSEDNNNNWTLIYNDTTKTFTNL